MKKLLLSLKRSPYQTFAAMLVLYFTLFLIGVVFIAMTFLYGLLRFVEGQPQVTAYFQVDTPEEEILAVRDELQNSNKVSSVEYISQEEAYEIYKELTKDNQLLIEMTSADILPASLEIYANRPQYLSEIAENLKQRKGVDEVQFQEIIVERLLTLTNAVKNAALVLCAFLIVMATIVTVATTSFKMALRKDEIDLMQLLGASNFFIMKPYLSEGFAMGIVASIISTLSLIGTTLLISPYIGGYLKGVSSITFSVNNQLTMVVWPFNLSAFLASFMLMFIFGTLIGFAANFLAARRYIS